MSNSTRTRFRLAVASTTVVLLASLGGLLPQPLPPP